MILIYLIFVNLFFLQNTEQARILCFFPTPSKSGVLMTQPLMVELAKKGHNVTVVSSFALGKQVENYHDVVISIEGAAKGK